MDIGLAIGIPLMFLIAAGFLFAEPLILLVAMGMAWRQIRREAELLPQADREAFINRKHAELDASFKPKKA